jgi:dihydrofolate synthase/folylpolyglutamate synthase
MTCPEALRYIHSLGRFGLKPGLERVRLLCAALGDPQARLRCVHVAGTNGKGSTCAMLAGIARAAGLKAGLYTSPYVTEFRERIQVNGEMIPEAALCRWTKTLRNIAQTLPEPVTEFEFVTALAFAWFAEQRCDAVILEVGLGGRWDATNLVEAPLCSVITKISLDHTEVLGDTLAKIAAEKCGIIKPGRPVVTACEQPPEALAVIRESARANAAPLTAPRGEECRLLGATLAGSEAMLAGLRVFVPLLGRHMCHNALTAVYTARLLGWPDEAIREGVAQATLPARIEVVSRKPLILLDGGHNPDGARVLAATLAQLCPGTKFCALCGMMADKDAGEFLRILRPHIAKMVTVRPRSPRALPARALARLAREAGVDDAVPADSPEHALRLAEYPLLVCGSFYLAGEIRNSIASR